MQSAECGVKNYHAILLVRVTDIALDPHNVCIFRNFAFTSRWYFITTCMTYVDSNVSNVRMSIVCFDVLGRHCGCADGQTWSINDLDVSIDVSNAWMFTPGCFISADCETWSIDDLGIISGDDIDVSNARMLTPGCFVSALTLISTKRSEIKRSFWFIFTNSNRELSRHDVVTAFLSRARAGLGREQTNKSWFVCSIDSENRQSAVKCDLARLDDPTSAFCRRRCRGIRFRYRSIVGFYIDI